MIPTGFIFTTLCLALVAEAAISCHEPSTEACKLLDQSIPNFCSGNLAPLECPKYCGLCQLSCYQCSQINDPSVCNHNVTCPDADHACIASETVGDDFSYHFNLGCVRKQYCSSDLPHSIVVGKRGVQKRNLKFGCCTTSLCNNVMPQQIAPVMPNSCPVGTSEYRESSIHICYYAILSMQNASESNKLCQQKYSSGRLAYIPSANAEYFMERALQSQFGNERGSGVWIGVFDNIQEGKFVDTDGEPQKYFNWRYDQPNDPNRNMDRDPAQDCVRSFPHDRHDIFSWQDKPCKENGLAICSINLHK